MKLSGEIVQDGVTVTMSVTGRYTAPSPEPCADPLRCSGRVAFFQRSTQWRREELVDALRLTATLPSPSRKASNGLTLSTNKDWARGAVGRGPAAARACAG